MPRRELTVAPDLALRCGVCGRFLSAHTALLAPGGVYVCPRLDRECYERATYGDGPAAEIR